MSTINDDDEDNPCQPLLSDSIELTIVSSHNGQQKAKNRWITIEPIVFLSYIGNGTIATIRTEYLQKRIGIDNYNYTSSADNDSISCITNTSDPDYIMQQSIQQEASQWILYLSIAGYLPLIFTTIILGTWSDTSGRKIALIIPLIGMVLQSIVYLLVIYFILPLPILLIGDLAGGITGGASLLLAASLSYIADITTQEQRTLRIVVVETTLLVSIGAANAAMGYFIDAKGFVDPFYLILACHTTAIAYTLLPTVLYETINPRGQELASLSIRSSLNKVFHSVNDLFACNVNGRRWRLILICAIFACAIEIIYGYISVFTLYIIGQPFCWTPITVGIYTAFSLFISSIGNVAGSKLLGLFLSDVWILHITLYSTIATMFVLGFAQQSYLVIVAVGVGALRALSMPIVRTLASKSVSANEQGVVFSVLGSIESIAIFLSPILFQPIYAAAVGNNGLPGSPFLLAAGIAVLGEIFALLLHCACDINRVSTLSLDLKTN